MSTRMAAFRLPSCVRCYYLSPSIKYKGEGILSKSEPIYHHLIPQTYMKPWCFNEFSIWTYNKTNQISKISNIGNICGIKYFHSIRAGSLYTNEISLNRIWSVLLNYRVLLGSDILDTPLKMNNSYSEFDNWEIYYPNTNFRVKRADRNRLKQKIHQTKYNNIEEQWSVQF